MATRGGRALALATATLALAAAWSPVGAIQPSFAPPAPDFADVASEAGLTFTCEHWNKNIGLAPRWFIDILFCASPVVADFNGDGFVDVFFPNQRYNNATLNNEREPLDALFLSNGDGTFRDASFLLPLDRGYSMGAAALDFDGDGDLDILVANYPELPAGFNDLRSPATTLYVNDGDGAFTRADAASLGLSTQLRCSTTDGREACVLDGQFGYAVAAADFDRDGDLDVYRGNYIRYDMRKGMPAALQQTIPDTNNFYLNNGDGTFLEQTVELGASRMAGRTFAVNFADFDGDGWPDVYVANDENPNELYLNRPVDAANPALGRRFVDFSGASGAADPRGSMCSEARDFDNDGDLDLYMSHYEDELNGYYLNNGDATFVNRDTLGDLGKSFHILGWACPSLDFDNDGDTDLFVANGHMLPTGGEFLHPGDPGDDNGYELPNFLFKNTLRDTGQHSWVDVSKAAGPGLLERKVSSGAIAADFDLDGALEIVVVENNDVATSLYKNRAQGLGHWLSVELRGAGGNTRGIGARVTVEAGTLVQTQQMLTGNTLGSGSAMPLHFGLGGHAGPVVVNVAWPSGASQSHSVAVDQPVRIVEGQGVALDTLAPAVDVQVQGTRGTNGWYTSPSLTVSLSAVERGVGAQSGLATLSYRLDGGAEQPYTGPFEVSGEGVHTLVAIASDAAGNRAWYPQELRIDSVAPSAQLTRPQEGKVHVQDRVLADSPTGDTILVAPVRTPNDAADQADALVEGARATLERHYGIGTPPPPATLAGLLASSVGSDGLTYVEVDAADATSGLSHAIFRLDGAERFLDRKAPFRWGADLRGLPAGEHLLEATVLDKAGLASTVQIRVVVVPSTQDGVLNTLMALTAGPSRAQVPSKVLGQQEGME